MILSRPPPVEAITGSGAQAMYCNYEGSHPDRNLPQNPIRNSDRPLLARILESQDITQTMQRNVFFASQRQERRSRGMRSALTREFSLLHKSLNAMIAIELRCLSIYDISYMPTLTTVWKLACLGGMHLCQHSEEGRVESPKGRLEPARMLQAS